MPRRASTSAFHPGLGLRVRMWIALALNALLLAFLLVGAYGLLWTEGGWAVLVFFAVFALLGVRSGTVRRRSRPSDPHVPPEVARRATRAVSRLSLVADLTVPVTVVVPDAAPVSWTTARPRRRPRVHVTTGLLEQLDDAQLEAVIAHELSHIGNRDAVLMTILAAPGVLVLRGFRAVIYDSGIDLVEKLSMLLYGCIYLPPAMVSAGLSRIVSRHRELAADRGAALLTGSPAALAAALMRLSDGLHAIPDRDLRRVAAADVLHVVPAKPASGIRRLWATHPRLGRRLRELERLEARLQA